MILTVVFLIGLIVYTFGAFLSNSPTLKASPYYVLIGIVTGIFANAAWFSLMKTVQDNSKVLILGFYWDIMIITVFVAIPVFFYGATFKPMTIFGLCLMFLGFILTKV